MACSVRRSNTNVISTTCLLIGENFCNIQFGRIWMVSFKYGAQNFQAINSDESSWWSISMICSIIDYWKLDCQMFIMPFTRFTRKWQFLHCNQSDVSVQTIMLCTSMKSPAKCLHRPITHIFASNMCSTTCGFILFELHYTKSIYVQPLI